MTSPSDLLLWAQVVLAWTIVQYALFGRDPTGMQEIETWAAQTKRRRRLGALSFRSILIGGIALILAGLSARSVAFASFCLVMAAALPLGRPVSARRRIGAEWETVVTLIFVVGSGLIIAGGGLELSNALVSIPVSLGRLAVICVGASVVLFAGPGGTHVVRGVLDRIGTLPKGGRREEGDEVDITEYNRGRVIGNLERVLLVATVAVGSYEAMGLIIAAKGLIRIKEFEDRNFAEYFLVGTLTSVTVAFVLGWLLRVAIAGSW